MGDTDAKTVDERRASDRPRRDGDTRDERGEPGDIGDGGPPPLPERYVAREELGRGGMGRVVEATDVLLGRTVAVKQALAVDSEALRRFQRETMITARLEHPSIVPLYDAGRAIDGTPYYVMRKVSGRRLDKLVAEAETLDQRMALLPHLLAAAQAVAHAHARGVIHRDIKPSNILVGDLGETIVIDWGLAKVLDEAEPSAPEDIVHVPGGSLHTRIGTVFGTPGFMSPEQARSNDVDSRSDVFALGATLYYLLARRPPHHADSEDDMIAATAERPVPPVEAVLRGVPAELATICDKSLAFAHAQRYADAGELAEDLRQFLAGQLVASHRYSAREKLGRFVRNNRVAVAAVAVAAVALAIGGTLAVSRVIAARDEALMQRGLAEDMRQREATRANEVTLAQARLLLDTNPTAAVALVKPLAASSLWRDVRAIAADAHAAGVAWQLPGERMRSVDMMPDGLHAVGTTNRGGVWFYDLRTRTGAQIADVGREANIVALSDALALAYVADERKHDLAATLIELPSGKRHELALSAPLRKVRSRGDRTWFVDRKGTAYTLDHATRAIERFAFSEPVVDIAPSPDGTTLAIGGQSGLWLVSGAAPERLADGRFQLATWSADGARVAGLSGDDMIDIELASRQHVRVRTSLALNVAIVDGLNYMTSITGISIDGRAHAGMTNALYALGLHETAGNALVTGEEATITVLKGRRRHTLRPPQLPVTRLSASPRSHYVVAICRSAVMLWDLEPILPKEYDAKPDAVVSFLLTGDHGLFAVHHNRPSDWIDLATGVRTRGPLVPFSYFHTEAPDRKRLYLYDRDGTGTLVTANTEEATPLGTDSASAWFVDDRRLAIGSHTGELRLYDLTTRESRVLVKHGDMPVMLLRGPSRRNWLVAGFADGTLWRMDVASGSQATWREAGRAWKTAEAVITADGRVWFRRENQLWCWRTDGTVGLHAVLPDGIDSLIEVDDDRVLANTNASDSFYVNLTLPNVIEPTTPLDELGFSLSRSAGLLAFTRRNAGLVVIDQAANAWFRTARLLDSGDLAYVSPDGQYAHARSGDWLLVWRITLPQTADETATWVNGMTNAVSGRGSALSWQ